MLADARWTVLEACRPHAKVAPRALRRTLGAILWRHDNGDKWRALADEHGPWWMAAQTFIRWSRPGVWERLSALVQEKRPATRHPNETERGIGGMSRVDLRPPQPGRALVGQAEGAARRRNALREDPYTNDR